MVISSGLVPLFVIDLLNPLFPSVGPVDRLGIIVGNISDLACLGNGVVVLVNQLHELRSLSIAHLDVLSDHGAKFKGNLTGDCVKINYNHR